MLFSGLETGTVVASFDGGSIIGSIGVRWKT